MKVDIVSAPPPLKFGEGDDSFERSMRKLTGTDRMAAMDAVAERSFEVMQRTVNRFVLGWSGVTDENDRAIPYETKDGNKKVCNLDAFLGSIPIRTQVEVLTGILAFAGVPAAELKPFINAFAGFEGGAVDPDPTAPPAGDTPESASTESSS